jgi:hypothetical protein
VSTCEIKVRIIFIPLKVIWLYPPWYFCVGSTEFYSWILRGKFKKRMNWIWCRTKKFSCHWVLMKLWFLSTAQYWWIVIGLGRGGWKWLRARRQEVLDGFITDVCKDVTFLIAIFRTVGRMMDTLWHWEDNRVIGNWRGTEQVEGAEVDLSNVRFTTASGSTRKAWAWQRMRSKISHILWIVMRSVSAGGGEMVLLSLPTQSNMVNVRDTGSNAKKIAATLLIC